MKISPQLFMLMKQIRFIIFVIVLTMPFSSFSQEKEKALGTLITDRPDATESPSTIPAGYIQVETGAFYESLQVGNIKDGRLKSSNLIR